MKNLFFLLIDYVLLYKRKKIDMTSFILSKTFFYFQQENCTYSLLSSIHFYRTYMQLGLKQSLSILLCSGLVFGSIPGFISSSSFYNIVHLFSVLMQISLLCLSCECVMRLLILCPLPRPLLLVPGPFPLCLLFLATSIFRIYLSDC